MGTVVTGAYKICIAKDGLIGDVAVVLGIPDADDRIITTLSTWRYKPQSMPICFVQFLEFHIDAPEGTLAE